MRKIKITHIITDLNTGGAEMMLYKLLSAYDRNRFEMCVISLTSEGTIGKKIKDLGVKVYSLHLRKNLFAAFAILQLKKIMRELQPDVLQGWMYHGNLFATIAAKMLHNVVPVVWNIRQSLYDFKQEKLLTAWMIKLCAWLSNKPAKILYNSYTSNLQHQKIGYSKLRSVIIPNGFDCDKLHPIAGSQLRRELGLNDDELLIGMVARYHPMKCHKNLIMAAENVIKSCNKVKFVLIGKGVDDFNLILKQQVKNAGLTNEVYLLGERLDAAEITATFDIAVLPSGWGEGFPNVIGEAMACGVPCVVTDVGDAAKIVGDTGVVVPANDVPALTSGLQQLIERGRAARKQLGLHARQRIIDNYSIAKVVSQYQNLYLRTYNGS
jgi:glycosyltransferase involved in cell wall biosynthesis